MNSPSYRSPFEKRTYSQSYGSMCAICKTWKVILLEDNFSCFENRGGVRMGMLNETLWKMKRQKMYLFLNVFLESLYIQEFKCLCLATCRAFSFIRIQVSNEHRLRGNVLHSFIIIIWFFVRIYICCGCTLLLLGIRYSCHVLFWCNIFSCMAHMQEIGELCTLNFDFVSSLWFKRMPDTHSGMKIETTTKTTRTDEWNKSNRLKFHEHFP